MFHDSMPTCRDYPILVKSWCRQRNWSAYDCVIGIMHLNPRKLAYGVHFGASEIRQELPGFSVSLLTPILRAEDVPLHTHDTASFVFVLSGLYVSKADGAPPNLRVPTLIFNP